MHFLLCSVTSTLLGVHTRSNSRSVNSSNNAAERAVHRIRAAAGEAMRYTLFALRCEMLWSAAKILRAIGATNGERCVAIGDTGAGYYIIHG
jgi:hypothetical protein